MCLQPTDEASFDEELINLTFTQNSKLSAQNSRGGRGAARTLAVKLGGVHALVDLACAATIFLEFSRERYSYETLCQWVLLYNALAFGLQWLIGMGADVLGGYRWVSACGVSLILAAILMEPAFPLAAVVLAGVGNACFHVGAGAVVLRQAQGRADSAGLFVGPGALGLVVGVWLGGQTLPWRAPCVALLALAGVFLLCRLPQPARLPSLRPAGGWGGALALLNVLLLGSVLIRSTAGGLLAGHWRASLCAFLALGGAAMLGKACGGLLADRYGWRFISALALLVCAPLLWFGLRQDTGAGHLSAAMICALLGMFVFQLTMPVTLVAVSLPLRAWPGLAFGLPCLALLLGAWPGLLGRTAPWHLPALLLPLLGVSLVLVWVGLGMVKRGAFHERRE